VSSLDDRDGVYLDITQLFNGLSDALFAAWQSGSAVEQLGVDGYSSGCFWGDLGNNQVRNYLRRGFLETSIGPAL